MSRILVCGVQTPYVSGGAEQLVETLAGQLRARGHQVDVVNLPFTDVPRTQILASFLAWRVLNLRTVHGTPVDRIICTKFPSYAVSHPDKLVWLTHQHRQAYELFGTRYSDMHTRPDGRLFAWLVRRLDAGALKSARRLYAISRNTAERLRRFNGLAAEPLYPPPRLAPLLRPGPYGDFLLAVGRFEPIKRFDLILRALALSKCDVRCVVAGDGLDRARLERLAEDLGLGGRVDFAGRVDDATLARLYSECLGVVYPPFDEDYGYVTVEAFLARKPVVCASDSGGPLEFVVDGENGYVAAPSPEGLAGAFARLYERREALAEMGGCGYERVREIGWDRVVEELAAGLAP